MAAPELKSLAAPLLDLVYPPACAGCGGPVPVSDVLICGRCMENLPWLREGGCSRCGGPTHRGGDCRLCARIPPELSSVRSTAWFSGCVSELVHGIKYGRRKQIAPLLAELAVAGGLMEKLDELPELIVPVPLHWSRQLRRGFNQSRLLAESLGELTGIRVAAESSVRVRSTASQTRLNPEQRIANVKGAFACRDAEAIDCKHVLIVDDVMTTGATLGEAARSLVESGPRRVSGWTFARA